MNPNLYLVVMAGGSGTRFWPKSTAKKPKQLLAFGSTSKTTLLGDTLARFEGIVPSKQQMIVTTELLDRAVRDQISSDVIVLAEPQGRNTAPCIYWAARVVAALDPKAVMLVMPSDHFFHQPEKFRESVKAAANWAATHDDLVTLGVKPTHPETGYGYLKTGDAIAGAKDCAHVEKFVEKPNREKAEQFLRDGNYLWNGGMFLWRAEVILKAFDQTMPEMKKIWDEEKGDVARAYPKLTATSIDYGVMERASNIVSFTLDCGWDDIGNWTSLENLADVLQAGKSGNTVTGGEVIAIESKGNIVDVRGKLVALLGVDDLIVVEQGEALLIARKDRSQDIRLVVDQVKKIRPDLA